MTHTLAIDFGGTRIRAALFDASMQIVQRTETLTRVADGEAIVLQRIIDLGKSVLIEGVAIKAIGIAAPGPLDTERGIIIHAKTLPGWRNVRLAEVLSVAFNNVPVFVQNDANLAALAEYHMGAGRGADPMLYLTISTGIGGGAVIGGKLFTGHSALAIEPGHMRFTLPDGSHRRLEELASGTALGHWASHYLQAATASDAGSILRDCAVVDGMAVGEAAMSGDPLALRVVTEAGCWLGLGLVNLIHLFNPQAIVLGGSVVKLGDLLLAPALEVIRENILHDKFYHDTLLRGAEVAEDVGLVGAAFYSVNRTNL